MQAVIFYLLLPFIYFISLLPFRVLYGISDVVYILIYHVLKYRRVVVFQNLKNSFPEKTSEEINQISKKYYRHLCDLIIENVKMLTLSEQAALKRCKFHDLSVFDKLYAEKKSVIIVMGHYGNFEWAGSVINRKIKHQVYFIYKPLSNKFFNDLMYKIRTRLGTKMIAANNTLKDMLNNKNIISATGFIADQTPAPDNAYWTNFLNQDTPVFWGTEKIARKLNYPVVFMSVKRVERGYYEVFTDLLSENPGETKEGEISEKHTRLLEQEIIKQPELWLWSHRRWKHKRSKEG